MTDEQQLEAQQPEENQEDRPSWLPDNFKSPEDMANSYKELQGEFTRTRQQMKEQQEGWESFMADQAQAAEQAQFQAQIPSIQDRLYSDWEQDPVATTARLIQAGVTQAMQQYAQPDPAQVETQAVIAGRYAEDQLQARYNDWQDYREKIAEEVQANPDLYPESLFQTPQGIQRALDAAYWRAKGSAAFAAGDSLEEQIAAQRQAKMQAQTLSGAAGRPPAQDDYQQRWEQITNAPSRSYTDLLS